MRKNNFLSCSLIFLILFLSGIFSCSNLFDGAKADNGNAASGNSTKTKTVSFKLMFDGALPSEILEQMNGGEIPPEANGSSSKTAMPTSFSASKYKIVATKVTLNGTSGLYQPVDPAVKIESVEFTSLTSPASIDLPYGTYFIEAVGLTSSGTTILSGSYKDPFDSSKNGVITVGESSIPLISIKLSPYFDTSEDATGTVALNISFDDDCQMQKVVAEWKDNGGDSKTQTIVSSPFSVTLKPDGSAGNYQVPVGSYNVTLKFYKTGSDTEPVAFTCEEMIHVFSGMTTNVWKNSGYGGCIDVNGNFILTNDVVNSRHIYYVNPSGGNDSNSGSAGEPLASLQTAADKIMANNDGSDYTIALLGDYVAGSAADLNGKSSLSGLSVVSIKSSNNNVLKLKIKSADDSNKYKIDAGRFGRCITVYGTENTVNVTVENIKITGAGGTNTGYGGGIYIFNNVNFVLNSGVEIIDNTSNKNGSNVLSGIGGGIYLNKNSSYIPTLTINAGAVIKDNTAQISGGGIYNNGGKIQINGGTIDGNTDSNGGSGIYNTGNYEINISGNPLISSENEIYLSKNNDSYKISVTDEITSEDLIPIYCGDISTSNINQQIIYDNTNSSYGKFALQSPGYKINDTGKINSYTDLKTCSSLPNADTYVITDKQGMTKLKDFAENSTLDGYTFILLNDIDMQSVLWTNGIGYGTEPEFKGTFDGNYHKISGININNTSGSSYVALFPKMEGCVKNLIVEGTVVGSGTYAGGIAGTLTAKGAKIDNCISFLNVTFSSGYASGIACNKSNGMIINCVNLGVVKGMFASGILSSGTVTNCVNLGKVYGSKNAGNIVNNKNDTNYTNCYSAFTPYKTSANAVIQNARIPDPPTSVINNFNTYVADNPGCNSWSSDNMIKVNNINYPVPVKGFRALEAVTIYKGTDPAGNYTVGDCVFDDGSIESDADIVNYNETLKSHVVGVVFTTTYDTSNGSNTNGNTVLMIGIHNVLEQEGYTSGIKFFDGTMDSSFYDTLNTTVGVNDFDGSSVTSASVLVSSEKYFPNDFPAVMWAFNYGTKYCQGTDFSSGWHLPTKSEGVVVYNNRSNINIKTNKVFNQTLISDEKFWTMSCDTNGQIFYIDEVDSTIQASENLNAVVIRKLQ